MRLLALGLALVIAADAGACVRAELLEGATDEIRPQLEELDRACREGLRLLREGRPGSAWPLLHEASKQGELLDRSLALPIAEAMAGAGAPVEETLAAWEAVTQPAELVEARRFELVERLAHGRAAELLAARSDRPSAGWLQRRAERDAARPEPSPRRMVAGRVGVLLPLSGPKAHIGAAVLRGIRLGLDSKTTLVLRDSAGAPAAANVESLAAEGVTVVVGAIDRVVAARAGEAAQRLGVPLIQLSVDRARIAAPDAERVVFRASLSPAAHSRALVARARELGVKRFAVLGPESAAGRAMSDAFVAAVRAAGGEVSAVVAYPSDTTGFQRLARDLRKERFSALFMADHKLGRVATVLRFLAREDIWSRDGRRKKPDPESSMRLVRVLGPALLRRASVPKAHRRYLSGLEVADERPRPGAPAALGERARAAFGVEAGGLEALGHDAIVVAQAARGSTRTSVVKRLREGAFDGALGRLRFDEGGEPIRPVSLYRVNGGEFEAIESGRN